MGLVRSKGYNVYMKTCTRIKFTFDLSRNTCKINKKKKLKPDDITHYTDVCRYLYTLYLYKSNKHIKCHRVTNSVGLREKTKKKSDLNYKNFDDIFANTMNCY